MDKNEIIEKLAAVRNALENIEVKGMLNMNNMIGSMRVIEEVIQAVRTSEPEQQE